MTRRNEYTGRFVGGDLLTALCKAENLPLPVREYRFAPPRRFRFDYAWPETMLVDWPNACLAVEIDGGVWIKGRHTRAPGFIMDMEKLNLAAMTGWLVLRYTPDQITTVCIDDIKGLLRCAKVTRIGRYPVIEAS